LRVRKAVHDVLRELELLRDYVTSNARAARHAVTALERAVRRAAACGVAGGMPSAARLTAEPDRPFPWPSFDYLLQPTAVDAALARAAALNGRVNDMEPAHTAWRRAKVYTIGCFDVLHRGHVNLLRAMRDFGNTVVVGIHDDASILALKGQLPVHPLAARLAALAPYADRTFVIADTDPTAAIQAACAPADLAARRCVYVRGDDMPDFPARAWVSTVMDVLLLPRTENVSTSFLRSLYSGGGGGGGGGGGVNLWDAAAVVAFAECDHLGRPILPPAT